MSYDEERQQEREYERQHHEELQHEHEMQKRLDELAEIAGYVVFGIIERIHEFDLPQSDIEYIVKSLPTLVQNELDKRTPLEQSDDDIPF